MEHGVYVQEISKTYRLNQKVVAAVQNCSFFLPQDQITGFLGPNGAGKTTLIKMLAGLILPDAGSILIQGSNKSHRQQIGVVLEGNRNIYWRLTPEENLLYFGRLRGVCGQELKTRIPRLLERFGLSDKRKAVVQTLSRGRLHQL